MLAFMPNPPPTSGEITRTFDSGTLNTVDASMDLMEWGSWLAA
jgi:hypothetical protein